MTDDHLWSRTEPDSPCIRVCVLHPAEGICVGCYRTRDEIAAWPNMTLEDRRTVTAALPARASRVSRRRGGRAARLEKP